MIRNRKFLPRTYSSTTSDYCDGYFAAGQPRPTRFIATPNATGLVLDRIFGTMWVAHPEQIIPKPIGGYSSREVGRLRSTWTTATAYGVGDFLEGSAGYVCNTYHVSTGVTFPGGEAAYWDYQPFGIVTFTTTTSWTPGNPTVLNITGTNYICVDTRVTIVAAADGVTSQCSGDWHVTARTASSITIPTDTSDESTLDSCLIRYTFPRADLIGTALPYATGTKWNAATGLNWGGYDDWRMPNIYELYCVGRHDRANPAIDPAFTTWRWWNNTWSSTPYYGSPGGSWASCFYTSYPSPQYLNPASGLCYTRPCRGGRINANF